jgi:hypothetical protein
MKKYALTIEELIKFKREGPTITPRTNGAVGLTVEKYLLQEDIKEIKRDESLYL